MKHINPVRKAHWDRIYQTKQPDKFSWYQEVPETSLSLIKELNLPKSARIFDNGGGDSKLVDYLLEQGYHNITVSDISELALENVKIRLDKKAELVTWLVADEAYCCYSGQYDLWHDRAAFHFLTDKDEINNYLNTVRKCVKPNGYIILATFSEEGPVNCSGLDVTNYSEGEMTTLFSDGFIKAKCFKKNHITPFGAKQNFLFCVFKFVSNQEN
jgi:SAM-dependent methyltransferase